MIALDLAEFSYTCFTPQSLTEIREIDPEIQKLFFKSTDSDAQLYTAIKNNEVVFIFRGSSSSKDFITDGKIMKTYAPEFGNGVYVHSGFYNQYREIIFEVMATLLTKFRKNDSKINVHCIGHSLGGALATLCSLMCKKTMGDKINVTCTTFGSPRVGNYEFAKSFECIDSSLRYVNESDAVTLIPRLYYYHVHGEIKLTGANKSSNYLNSLKTYFLGNVSDHYLSSYKTNLN